MTLIDTNVLLDVATDDPRWADWSLVQLQAAGRRGGLVINDVVYAEFSVGYVAVADVDAVLDDARIDLAPIPRTALFMAGKVFRRYRAGGGVRTGVLPDFLVGAHAASAAGPS
jgi:predicted nucleic acid-binding protein